MITIIVKKKCRNCGEVQTVREKYPDRQEAATAMISSTLQPCHKCGWMSFVNI